MQIIETFSMNIVIIHNQNQLFRNMQSEMENATY